MGQSKNFNVVSASIKLRERGIKILQIFHESVP